MLGINMFAVLRVIRHSPGILRLPTSNNNSARWISAVMLGYRRYHDRGAVNSACHRIDLRSDTVTKPSRKMRQAMAEADVGDDVYGEDPTVNELQNTMAEKLGMEAALFVPTGTMGNLICVLAHCQTRGLEVLLGDQCHISMCEQGGIAQMGGVHSRTVQTNLDGTFNLQQLKESIRSNDVHYPITSLICLENSHNFCGGKVLPLHFMSKVRELANEYSLGVHMDGARVMNAAVALGVPLWRVVRDVDTVSLCFSKGLGAPIGSVIAGSEKFIQKAHRIRKALGGGMRQVGILAAAALVSIEDARERLALDHQHAKHLANAFNKYGEGVASVDVDEVHTNIIMVRILRPDITAAQLCNRLNKVTEEEFHATKDDVILSTNPFTTMVIRVVTNSNITKEDIDLATKKIKYVMEELGATKVQPT